MPDAEILLYEPIGASFGGATAAMFATALSTAGDGSLTVRVNSPGGEVFDGLAIYNLLLAERRKGRKVVAVIDGVAASAASIVCMGADEVHMAESSAMMIHNPWGLVVGGADDMRAEAEVLDKIQQLLISAYAKKTRKRPETLARLLKAETWMTPAEAQAEGFADKVVPPPSKAQARWNLTRFAGVPADVLARFGQLEQPPAPPTAQEMITMSTTQSAADIAASILSANEQELHDLRALRAAVIETTGEQTGLVGAVRALKANSDSAKRVSESAMVRSIVAEMVESRQIGPHERATYEAYSLADAQATQRLLRKPEPLAPLPQSPGPVPAKAATERLTDEAAKTAAQAKARELITGQKGA